MDRRRFCQTAVGAAVAASIPTSQAVAAALQALTTVAGDIDGITGDGDDVVLKQAEVLELSDSLRGRLLLPGNFVTYGFVYRYFIDILSHQYFTPDNLDPSI